MEQPPYDIQRMGKYVGYWISVGYRSRHCFRHGIGMGVAFGAGIGLIVGAAWRRRLGGSGE